MGTNSKTFDVTVPDSVIRPKKVVALFATALRVDDAEIYLSRARGDNSDVKARS